MPDVRDKGEAGKGLFWDSKILQILILGDSYIINIWEIKIRDIEIREIDIWDIKIWDGILIL